MNPDDNRWRRSSYCANGACVECHQTENDFVLVRDSKLDDDSPILAFPLAAWREFTEALRDGELVRA